MPVKEVVNHLVGLRTIKSSVPRPFDSMEPYLHASGFESIVEKLTLADWDKSVLVTVYD